MVSILRESFCSIGFIWYIPLLHDWNDNDGMTGYMLSSREGEESDTKITLNPITNNDMPTVTVKTDEAFAVTAHWLAILGRRSRKQRQVCHCSTYHSSYS